MKLLANRVNAKFVRGRVRVVACGVVVALGSTMLFDGTGPAGAANGDPVKAGNDTSATFGTGVFNTEAGQVCPTDISFVALYGCGSSVGVVGDGFTGVAGHGTGVGVSGSAHFTGVSGNSDLVGVHGTTTTGTGVKGENYGATGIGVWGEGAGTGSAVYGHAVNNGVGVFGDTTDGVGVQARSTNGKALNVLGRAAFSNSGTANVPATKASVKVTGVQLTSSSFVVATLQGNVAGTWVRGVSMNVGNGSLTIYLNKAVSQVRVVGFFIVG